MGSMMNDQTVAGGFEKGVDLVSPKTYIEEKCKTKSTT